MSPLVSFCLSTLNISTIKCNRKYIHIHVHIALGSINYGPKWNTLLLQASEILYLIAVYITHSIHVWLISLHCTWRSTIHVGKYPYTDGMGNTVAYICTYWGVSVYAQLRPPVSSSLEVPWSIMKDSSEKWHYLMVATVVCQYIHIYRW